MKLTEAPEVVLLQETTPEPDRLRVLNEHIRKVAAAFDQVASREVYRDIVVDGGDTNMVITTDFRKPPISVEAVGVWVKSTGTAAATTIKWEPLAGSDARITSFVDLSSGTQYTVRLRIVGEV